jgi:hypothetical protein
MTSLPSLTSTSIPSLFELCISVIAQTNQVFASVYVPKTILETIFDVAKENGNETIICFFLDFFS